METPKPTSPHRVHRHISPSDLGIHIGRPFEFFLDVRIRRFTIIFKSEPIEI